MAGRGYADHGVNVAADFIAEAFDSLGLATLNGQRFQRFSHPVNTFPSAPVVFFDDQQLKPGQEFLVNARSGPINGKFGVVHVDTTYLEKPGELVISPDFAYLVHPVSPANRDGASKRSAIIEQIAAIALVINPVNKLTWSVGTTQLNTAVIEVDASLVDWKNAESVAFEIESILVKNFESRNIFAVVPGTSMPDSFLVFTAHYDHLGKMGETVFPGANDNASGTAMLLDLASHFSANPLPVSILFIAFAGEEAGLVGSKFFVDNPLIPLAKISFLINLDLTGNGEDGITVVNGKMFEDDFRRLAEINTNQQYVAKIRARGSAANSDHYWFSKHGVRAFFIYTHGERKAYHDIYDVPETLHFLGYEGLFGLVVEFVNAYD
jgi:hypothetical protein